MIINEQDIREMVTECVSMLLERHGAIDEKLEGLADLIIAKYEEGGGIISANEINSINPYFKTAKPIKVTIVDGGASIASYDYKTNEIEINKQRFNSRYSAKESIMHELSHFIDLNARTKAPNPPRQFSTNGPKDIHATFANDILYFFRPTEMQARLTQYAYFLKEHPEFASKKLIMHENEKVLKIGYMRTLLAIFNGAQYNSPSEDIVQMVANIASYDRVEKRGGTYSNSAFWEDMSKKEFILQKEKISKILTKRLKSFVNKAAKIKYDCLNKD